MENLNLIIQPPLLSAYRGSKGIRKDYSPQSKTFLKKHGNEVISSLVIQRTPLSSVMVTALNLVSLGRFEKEQEKLGYDSFYHLSLIVNNKYTIEKNEVINVSDKITPKGEYGERLNITNIPPNLTIHQFLQNTLEKVGVNKFFLYDPRYNNCQDFLINLLRHNQILRREYQTFIKQDAEKLFSKMPLSYKMARAITDLGGIVHRINYGGNYLRKKRKGKGKTKYGNHEF